MGLWHTLRVTQATDLLLKVQIDYVVLLLFLVLTERDFLKDNLIVIALANVQLAHEII